MIYRVRFTRPSTGTTRANGLFWVSLDSEVHAPDYQTVLRVTSDFYSGVPPKGYATRLGEYGITIFEPRYW